MQLALASLYNLCLYFFRNCKITNKVFESFVQISLEKNIRSDRWNVVMFHKSIWTSSESYKVSEVSDIWFVCA